MKAIHHLAAGAGAAVCAGYFSGPSAGAWMLAGSVLIDADHYAWYLWRFRDASPRRMTRFFLCHQADDHYCLCLLHTLEMVALYVVALGCSQGPLFWLSAGCLLHVLLDVAQGVADGGLLRRRWSVIGGIVHWARKTRRRGCSGAG